MNIIVTNLTSVAKPDGTWIRFAVTLLDDGGEPLWTQEGFLLTPRWEIRTPATRSRFGSAMRTYTHISPKFEGMLLDALEAVEGVKREMPPRFENNKKIEGEGRVL